MARQERAPALDSRYDVIIIGAGIGGLTCCAALDKAGKRVLICEQHTNPGGYVTSFKRKGFTFDSGLQSFGSNGVVFLILRELGLYDKVRFVLAQLQIITLHLKLDLDSFAQVKERLKRAFPEAKGELDSYFREFQRLVTPIEEMFTGGKPALPPRQ